MTFVRPRLAIIGAGLGGLAAAAALRRLGFDPQVFEQAGRFGRVGAGINVSPNATKALAGLGVEERLLGFAHLPDVWLNRRHDSGALIREIPLGAAAKAQYGARFIQMHRADLHTVLVDEVPSRSVHLGKRLVGLDQDGSGVTLRFEDGTMHEADVVIGADGIHSKTRKILLGDQPLRFTGRVAYRGVIPAADLKGVTMSPFTKWWGPDRHIVIYYISGDGDVYYVTSVPDADWRVESWSSQGNPDELRAWFTDFHPEVRSVLSRCHETHKWALYDREPLPTWYGGNSVLIGDACHPMTPYLAQGAAMAIEDAVVLARCLHELGTDDLASTFSTFQSMRLRRTSAVQQESGENQFGLDRGDPGWLYSYDAWNVPVEVPTAAQP